MNTLKKDNVILLLSALASLLVFVIDFFIPLGVAGGVPYILTILIMGLHTKYKHVWIAAVITSLLVVLGFYLSPSGGELWKVLVNRVLAIFAIWVTTILIIKSKGEEKEKLKIQKDIADQFEKTAKEREILLQEIHHRVKNNLQITSSLLNLQLSYVDNDKAKTVLQASNHRIKSMALVHEMLYESDDLSKVNYSGYLKKLVTELAGALQNSQNPVKIKFNLSEIHLNIDTAVPVGLLVNEIVTNSLKYGANSNGQSVIEITIQQKDESSYIMLIGDNGSGCEDQLENTSPKSLGFRLIKNLITQLRGSIKRDTEKEGTNYIINFQIIQKKKPVDLV